jgi:hypothetical protein
VFVTAPISIHGAVVLENSYYRGRTPLSIESAGSDWCWGWLLREVNHPFICELNSACFTPYLAYAVHFIDTNLLWGYAQ